jgi:hypothetical protein
MGRANCGTSKEDRDRLETLASDASRVISDIRQVPTAGFGSSLRSRRV